MAAPAGSYQRFEVSNELEDIAPLIYDTSPTECPMIQNAARGSVDNTRFDWTEDQLDAADGTNAHVDGDVFLATDITAPDKLTNECQIARKDFRITRRARKIAKTGQVDEVARQTVRKGRELKRDMETIVMQNQAKVADNGTLAPLTASINTWIADLNSTGRTDRDATTGADPTGDGSDAATDSSAVRAMTETGLLGVIKGIYLDSQEMPDAIMMGPSAKQQFSKYMFTDPARIATPQMEIQNGRTKGLSVVGAVDVWVSDYGVVDIVPDRFQRERDAIVCNMDFIEISYFDPISTDAMAKDADDDSRMVLADFGLMVRNRYTLGVFADVNEAVAMTA